MTVYFMNPAPLRPRDHHRHNEVVNEHSHWIATPFLILAIPFILLADFARWIARKAAERRKWDEWGKELAAMDEAAFYEQYGNEAKKKDRSQR